MTAPSLQNYKKARWLLVGAGLAILAVAGFSETAMAAKVMSSAANGRGTITVFRPLSAQKTADLSFGRLQNNAGNGTLSTVTVTPRPPGNRRHTGTVKLLGGAPFSPLIANLSGEPNRIYRVSLPSSVTSSPGGLKVGVFKVWTANRDLLSAAGLGQLSATGVDTIRVGATLRVPKGTPVGLYGAIVPVTVSYE